MSLAIKVGVVVLPVPLTVVEPAPLMLPIFCAVPVTLSVPALVTWTLLLSELLVPRFAASHRWRYSQWTCSDSCRTSTGEIQHTRLHIQRDIISKCYSTTDGDCFAFGPDRCVR